jgi:hypothetical protein
MWVNLFSSDGNSYSECILGNVPVGAGSLLDRILGYRTLPKTQFLFPYLRLENQWYQAMADACTVLLVFRVA